MSTSLNKKANRLFLEAIENNLDFTFGTLSGRNVLNVEGDAGFLVDLVGEELTPEEVFSDQQLEAWAESNGWVKE